MLEEQRAASSVLEEPEGQRAARSALYIPECTADGRYNKLQCYNSTGYCWCVNEDTGKPIPGTSAKDRRPACDTLAPTMKGKGELGSLPAGRVGPRGARQQPPRESFGSKVCRMTNALPPCRLP